MAHDSIRKEINESTYDDVQKIVFKLSRDFSVKYQIPYDDLHSAANRAFMTAVDSFDRSHGASVSSWVYLKVFRCLQSYVRKEIPHRINHTSFEEMVENGVEHMPTCTQPNQFLFVFCDEISEAARAIVETIMDSKIDFALECHWHKVRTPHKMLSVVQEHFQDLGWDRDDIADALKEISEALSRAKEKRAARKREKREFLKAIEQTQSLVQRQRALAREPRALQRLDMTALEVALATS